MTACRGCKPYRRREDALLRLLAGCWRLARLLGPVHFEPDLLALVESIESVHPDRAEVGEKILATIIRRDKASALGVVEPHYRTAWKLRKNLHNWEHRHPRHPGLRRSMQISCATMPDIEHKSLFWQFADAFQFAAVKRKHAWIQPPVGALRSSATAIRITPNEWALSGDNDHMTVGGNPKLRVIV